MISICTTKSNISTDGTKHSCKCIWTLPRCGECANSPATTTTNGPVASSPRKSYNTAVGCFFHFYFGQNFFENKAGIVVAKTIMLVTAIVTIKRSGLVCCPYLPVHYKHAYCNWHFTFVNKVVEYSRRLPLYAILVYINTS